VVAFAGATFGGTANDASTAAVATSTPSSAPGDLLLCWINTANGTATAPTMATVPADWALVDDPITDGSIPQLGAWLYYRVVHAGDSTAPAWTFSTGSNTTWVMGAWSGCDPSTPFTNASVDAFTGTTTTKPTAIITTIADGWVVTGWGDRSGDGYTSATDTFRASSTHPSSTSSWMQDSNGDVPAGTISRTITGPSTSVGSSFILRLNPVTGAGVNAATATGTGRAFDARVVHSPLKEWLDLPAANRIVAHRGGSVDYVEMTDDAYTHMDQLKLPAREVSVWRSSDGVWVCSHDRSTLRVTGTDLDIPANTWATLSVLRTTTGGFPLARLDTLLAAHPDPAWVWFIENKQDLNVTAFLDLLDGFTNSTGRFVIKSVPGAATATTGITRGYSTLGIYYETDLPNLDATSDGFVLLGMDYTASGTAWATILTKSKPVLGHVVLSAANAATAYGLGAAGLISGKIAGVVPNVPTDTVAGSGLTLDASLRIAPVAGMVAGVGQVFDATVSFVPMVDVAAGLAAGTGQAMDALTTVLAQAETATGIGHAFDATVAIAQARQSSRTRTGILERTRTWTENS